MSAEIQLVDDEVVATEVSVSRKRNRKRANARSRNKRSLRLKTSDGQSSLRRASRTTARQDEEHTSESSHFSDDSADASPNARKVLKITFGGRAIRSSPENEDLIVSDSDSPTKGAERDLKLAQLTDRTARWVQFGDILWGRQNGFPWWPVLLCDPVEMRECIPVKMGAKIDSNRKKGIKEYLVFFYGTLDYCLLKIELLSDWSVSFDKRRKGTFDKGRSRKRKSSHRISALTKRKLDAAVVDAQTSSTLPPHLRYAYFRRWLTGQKDPKVQERAIPGCWVCLSNESPQSILLCDNAPHCSREYHMECLEPPLQAIPSGTWFCPRCTKFKGLVKRREARNKRRRRRLATPTKKVQGEEGESSRTRRSRRRAGDFSNDEDDGDRIRIGDEYQVTSLPIPGAPCARSDDSVSSRLENASDACKARRCTHAMNEPCPKYRKWSSAEEGHFERSQRASRKDFHAMSKSLRGRCNRTTKEFVHYYYTCHKRRLLYDRCFSFEPSHAGIVSSNGKAVPEMFAQHLWPRLYDIGWNAFTRRTENGLTSDFLHDSHDVTREEGTLYFCRPGRSLWSGEHLRFEDLRDYLIPIPADVTKRTYDRRPLRLRDIEGDLCGNEGQDSFPGPFTVAAEPKHGRSGCHDAGEHLVHLTLESRENVESMKDEFRLHIDALTSLRTDNKHEIAEMKAKLADRDHEIEKLRSSVKSLEEKLTNEMEKSREIAEEGVRQRENETRESEEKQARFLEDLKQSLLSGVAGAVNRAFKGGGRR